MRLLGRGLTGRARNPCDLVAPSPGRGQAFGAKPLHQIARRPDVENFIDGTSNFLALRRGAGMLTLVRSKYFVDHVSAWFDLAGVVKNTVGGHQTGYLLRRKA